MENIIRHIQAKTNALVNQSKILDDCKSTEQKMRQIKYIYLNLQSLQNDIEKQVEELQKQITLKNS